MSVLAVFLSVGLLAATGIYNPQVVRHHHCIAEPGTVDALYCPAPAATPHHPHGQKQVGHENNAPARVLKVLDDHFPRSEYLAFDSLGVIQPVAFPHAFDNEHSFELSKLTKRLSVLENIIRRHTR